MRSKIFLILIALLLVATIFPYIAAGCTSIFSGTNIVMSGPMCRAHGWRQTQSQLVQFEQLMLATPVLRTIFMVVIPLVVGLSTVVAFHQMVASVGKQYYHRVIVYSKLWQPVQRLFRLGLVHPLHYA